MKRRFLMAEIKSAVELAMERTKGLRLSNEEKEKLKEEEIQTRARGLVNRYLEADFHTRDVERELARLDPPERKEMEILILQYLSEAIDLDRENDLVFRGLESFREGNKGLIEKMEELIQRYTEKKGREYQKVEKDLLADLERRGVTGSAVQPAVEGTEAWEKARARIRPEFEKELEGLKKGL
jgi:hypothetical protein